MLTYVITASQSEAWNLSAGSTATISLLMHSGNFKYICEKHNPHLDPVKNEDIFKRHKQGKKRRAIFKKLSGYSIIVIPQCCIENNDFEAFRTCSFYNNEFKNVVQMNLKNYQRNEFTRFDYTDFLLGPIITRFCKVGLN